jgi:AraC family transcriptional regulator
MTQNSPRAEYDRRMHRVFEHIDRHLDQPLELATLADVAYFSPFHFHRLFAAWMGETLGDYIRRRRVEVAAQKLLLQPELSVLAAALAVGFGSGEAFARAFKLRFGQSPTAWRHEQRAALMPWRQPASGLRNPSQGQRNLGQAGAGANGHDGASSTPGLEATMTAPKVKLIDRPAVPIAYLRHVGPYGEGVGRFWQAQFHPWRAQHGLQDQASYGIGHDDPDITAPEQCRYDACTELPAGFVAPRSMLTTTLPAGRYAVMAFVGTSQTIGTAWQQLLRQWLPDSGYQMDAKPCFEHYTATSKFDPVTGLFSCDLCVAVVPL